MNSTIFRPKLRKKMKVRCGRLYSAHEKKFRISCNLLKISYLHISFYNKDYNYSNIKSIHIIL